MNDGLGELTDEELGMTLLGDERCPHKPPSRCLGELGLARFCRYEDC